MQTQNESETRPPATSLIAGSFAVNIDRPLPGLGGGLPAFAVTDHRGGRSGLIALQSPADALPRAQALGSLVHQPVEGVASPLGYGQAPGPGGVPAWFVICLPPSGTPLWPDDMPTPPWRESELLNCVLRPAAAALERLQARHVTHRGIRPGNLFRGAPGEAVMLGCAWGVPAASRQQAIFEPPYMAVCLPGGRGEGAIADDVYALGVTLICLALGRAPMQDLDDATVVRRKLENGSYAALVGEERLPSALADIVRGMLAEDPDHRPPPSLLADPAAARARRVAARPPQRAQVALDTPSGPAWNVRTLAHAMTVAPEQGIRMLRSGAVDRWLRRHLGDTALAARLDEARRQRGGDSAAEETRADALLLTRAIAALDPLAPVAWQGLCFWPDAIGPILADPAAAETRYPMIAEMLEAEALTAWGAMRPERCDPLMLRGEAHQLRLQLRTRGPGGGLRRLRYALNPLLSCASPMLAARRVSRLIDLLPALEAAAAAREGHALPIDSEIAAFLGARHDQGIEGELAQCLAGERAASSQLRILAGLQQRQRFGALPGIASWLKPQLVPALNVWRGRERREAMQRGLDAAVARGDLRGTLAVLEDPAEREADAREARGASEGIAAIDAAIAKIEADAAGRVEVGRRVGHELVLATVLCGLAVAGIAAAVG